jgi:hypothetical protein
MRTLSQRAAPVSLESLRPSGREDDRLAGSVLADVAYLLWPTNTAPNLAFHVGCDVRSAERYLAGTRQWSGDAMAAIVAEILKRHSMRNVKVKTRK